MGAFFLAPGVNNWYFNRVLKDLKYFVQISRPLNVGISVLAFAVSCLLANQMKLDFLMDLPFWGTIFTIVCIAASGYWINDVYDFRIDRVNKPGRIVVNALLSVKKVLTVYFLANLGILMFSFWYLGFRHAYYQITFINFLSVFLLFVYAAYLKRVSVAGNLVIAFLTALVIMLAGYLYHVNMPLVWAMVFAFEITFIREIVKDIEDIEGDLKFGLNTLPIQIGIHRTKYVLTFLYVCFILSCYLPFVMYYLRHHDFLWWYMGLSVGLVQIPSILLLRQLWDAQEKNDFSKQSQYLKYLILPGMLTLFFLLG